MKLIAMRHESGDDEGVYRGSVKNIYFAIGGVLVVAGVLGIIVPGPVLGLFEVNTLHNIIHLASGGLALAAAAQGIGAMRTWGRALGLMYLVVAVAGTVDPSLYGLMHVNQNDNLLHFGLAAIFLYVGFLAPPTL
jgi:hypothetical protein